MKNKQNVDLKCAVYKITRNEKKSISIRLILTIRSMVKNTNTKTTKIERGKVTEHRHI